MALVLNASSVDQHVKVFGQHFDLKAGQIKMFTDTVARFLITERADRGFVGLPDEFQDPEYKTSDKGKQRLTEAKALGKKKRIEYLKRLIQNETVSLQQDLDIAGMKVDARTYMSDGMVENMKELTSYQRDDEDEAEEKLRIIKKLEEQLK